MHESNLKQMLTMEPRVTEGSLETADGRLLPLEWTKVEAKIHGPLATVRVRQKFRNPTSETLEATYLFPLPHQASVFAMEFRLGERLVKGRVKEKEEARRAYQAARSEGRAATLLEQERPNLFTLSVANIAPNATIEVVLDYQELLTFDGGDWRFSFPMLASERYHAGAPTDQANITSEVTDGHRIRPPRARQNQRVSPISLQVRIEAQPGMQAPESRSHPITIASTSEGYEVQLSDPETVPNRDFVMSWKCPHQGLRPQIWFERQEHKPGTFCLSLPAPHLPSAVVTPKTETGKGISCGNCGGHLERKEAIEELQGFGMAWKCDYCGVFHPITVPTDKPQSPNKDVVFLLDLSASMRSLNGAAQVILGSIAQMKDEDSFQIIGFHHQLTRLSADWLPCNGTSQERAAKFLSGLRPHGGTELEVALRAACKKPRSKRNRVIVLITDGAVGNEGRLLRELPKILGDARLYVLGLGPSVNRYLIDKMALHGRGAFDVAAAGEAEVLARFAQRVSAASPVLTDLSVSWAEGAGMDIYPREALDLFSGQSIRVTGRYLGEGPARLMISATLPDGSPFRQELMVDLPESTPQAFGLERIWARQRIDDLGDQLTRHPEQLSEVRYEVLSLALKHQLMSPYTALVAEDSEQSVKPALPSRQVEVELASPEPEAVRAAPGEVAGERLRSMVFADAVGHEEDLIGSPAKVALDDLDEDLFGGLSAPPGDHLRKGLVRRSEGGAVGRPMMASKPSLGASSRPTLGASRSAPPAPAMSAPIRERHAPVESDWVDELCDLPATTDDDLFGSSGGDDLFGSDDMFSDGATCDLVEVEGTMKDIAHSDFGALEFEDSPDFEDFDNLFDSPPVMKCRTPSPITGGSRQQTPIQRQSQTAVSFKSQYSPEELARAKEMMKGRLDLVFLVDETGSMGPYIQQVQKHLLGLVRALKASPLCQTLRLGLVTFRDHPPQDDSFVTRVVPLTENIEEISQGVSRMRADGGGDGPEAVTDGLHELLNLHWDSEAARLVVMVGDAPPHGVEPSGDGFPDGCPCGHHWHTQAESCREMGITVHTVGCYGIERYHGAVQVFQSVARTTGGLYLPLDEASLLIDLVSGLADRELDRQLLEQYVAKVFQSHRAALEQADADEQVRFITETLQAQNIQVLELYQGVSKAKLRFRPVEADDVRLAFQSVLRRQPVPA